MYDPTDTGLFWTHEQYVRRGQGQIKENPLISLRQRLKTIIFPDTYTPPPLINPPSGVIAYDLETEDPGISEGKGASWAFPGNGEIIGVSVAWEHFNAYYPINHCSGNVDDIQVMDWVKYQLKRPDIKFICANAGYDIGWTKRECGMYPVGGVIDIQHMAAILDEYSLHYSLDAISKRYLGIGKELSRLEQLEKQYGVDHKTMMGCLKYLPGPVVAQYAGPDSDRTLRSYHAMLPLIKQQGLMKILELESTLIPMCTEMRRIGIPINIDAAQQLSEDIKINRIPAIKSEIKRLTTVDVEPWNSDSCHDALQESGITGFKKTANGSWSINAEQLDKWSETSTVAKYILDLRKMSKISGTFLDGQILHYSHKNRLHAEFHQLRSEKDSGGFGTVTGRFSATGPALLTIPIHDPEWGPQIRKLFPAEDGEEYCSLDYSGQEPRMAVHFANKFRYPNGEKLKGIDDAVEAYKKDPKLSLHRWVAKVCGISYDRAKRINLGLGYGMGQAKLARSLDLPTQWMSIHKYHGQDIWQKINLSEVADCRLKGYQVVEVAGDEAKKILKAWEEGAPFIKGLYKVSEQIANERGFIVTLLRRRCRFPSFGDGSREGTYKAMNKLCQSSAADQTKASMAELWKENIIPKIPIHDELLLSVSNRKISERTKEIMEHTTELCIPTHVDMKYGQTWGDIEK